MKVAALLLLALLASCASSQHGEEGTDPDAEMSRALQELEGRKAELRNQVGRGDCNRSCQLAGVICSASHRICAIAEQNPTRRDFAGRCREATTDCEEARTACERCK